MCSLFKIYHIDWSIITTTLYINKEKNVIVNVQIRMYIQCKESKGAKIRNRYNQVPYLTQITTGTVIFMELGSTGSYFEGFGEQAHSFGDLGSPAKSKK